MFAFPHRVPSESNPLYPVQTGCDTNNRLKHVSTQLFRPQIMAQRGPCESSGANVPTSHVLQLMTHTRPTQPSTQSLGSRPHTHRCASNCMRVLASRHMRDESMLRVFHSTVCRATQSGVEGGQRKSSALRSTACPAPTALRSTHHTVVAPGFMVSTCVYSVPDLRKPSGQGAGPGARVEGRRRGAKRGLDASGAQRLRFKLRSWTLHPSSSSPSPRPSDRST